MKPNNQNEEKKSIDNPSLEIVPRKELQQLLLLRTEQKTQQESANRGFQKKEIELLSGKKYTVDEILASSKSPYNSLFPLRFYQEIYRLNNWEKKDPTSYIKPKEVGKWTNEIIYGRFHPEVLQGLKEKNPLGKNWVRLNKHFQWLTEAGKEMLVQYISDATAEMQNHSDWYEFRKAFFRKYGIGYQVEMFR